MPVRLVAACGAPGDLAMPAAPSGPAPARENRSVARVFSCVRLAVATGREAPGVLLRTVEEVGKAGPGLR